MRYKGPLGFYKNIKDGYTTLEKAEEKKSVLNKIVKGKSEYKLEEQKRAIKNIKTLYKSREKVIKLFNDYSKVRSKAK